jgi:hypothetical protein
MKSLLTYGGNEPDLLANLIRQGLKGYAANVEQLGGMTTLWCFLCDDSVLRIDSVMTDVSGWLEVGTLAFELVTDGDGVPVMIPLPKAWGHISSLNKLVLEEPEFSSESGLIIKAESGDDLIVVCGAEVYTVQILAPFFLGTFQPEYEIERYKALPL